MPDDDFEVCWRLLRKPRRRNKAQAPGHPGDDFFLYWSELGVVPAEDREAFTPDRHLEELLAQGLPRDFAEFMAFMTPLVDGRAEAASNARYERRQCMERFGAVLARVLQDSGDDVAVQVVSSLDEATVPRALVESTWATTSLARHLALSASLPTRLYDQPLGADSLIALRRGYERAQRRRRRRRP
ncbi:MAG: hypothetical protein HYZ29_16015 [Myxococcales bacterium]|jgi:hypothetical protein|nr:hypothetical protein [Myxococcales bacterium]